MMNCFSSLKIKIKNKYHLEIDELPLEVYIDKRIEPRKGFFYDSKKIDQAGFIDNFYIIY